jgi:hypothetical protein
LPTPADQLSPSRRSGPLSASGAVYVGGLDLSGKTTMSAYLTSHSRIAIPAVGSIMWTYFYRQYGDLARPKNLERCLHALLTYQHVTSLQPDVERVRADFAQGPPTYARLFEIFLVHFAQREGKPRWGAQTGPLERHVPELIDAYEGVRIIHMLRDPRDRYLASLELWPNRRGRAGGATARWQYSTRLAEEYAVRYPAQFLVIRFEDLITSTETTMRLVCAFLGEQFEPSMLEMARAPRPRDRLVGAAAHAANGAGPKILSPEHIGRFRGRVPLAELEFMQQRAGRRMVRHHYDLEPVELSSWGRVRYPVVDWPSQMTRMVAWRAREGLQERLPRPLRRRPERRMRVDPA